MNRISTILTLVATLSVLAVSCQRDDMGGQNDNGTAAAVHYAPAISIIPEGLTKSSYAAGTAVIPEGDASARITSEVYPASAPMTRGDLINRDGSSTIAYPTAETFHVTAWDADGTSAAIAWSEVKYFDTVLDGDALHRNMWNTVDSNGRIVEYIWLQNVTMKFYAYGNLPEGAGEASVTTDGTTGKATGMELSYTVPTTASAQADLLMGSYIGKGDSAGDGKQDGTASITFKHALSSVVLKMGTVEGAVEFRITGIGIEGVYGKATATMTSSDNISWAPEMSEDKPVTTSVSQEVTITPEKDAEVGEPFIVIPQDFDTCPARLVVNIDVDGKNVNIYYPLSGGAWLPGYVYTYTLDYNGHEGIQLWEDGPYWATRNVGADKPEDYGWYFNWGNVTGYVSKNMVSTENEDLYNCKVYSAEGNVLRSGGFTSVNFEDPGKSKTANIPVDAEYDAAYKNMGTKWRLPTKEECEGLIDDNKTTRTYTRRNGVEGYIVKGKGTYSGRSIFIPASGFINEELIGFIKKAAFLRTSSYISSKGYTLVLGYNSSGASHEQQDNREYAAVEDDLRYGGRVIRAVENTEYKKN